MCRSARNARFWAAAFNARDGKIKILAKARQIAFKDGQNYNAVLFDLKRYHIAFKDHLSDIVSVLF